MRLRARFTVVVDEDDDNLFQIERDDGMVVASGRNLRDMEFRAAELNDTARVAAWLNAPPAAFLD